MNLTATTLTAAPPPLEVGKREHPAKTPPQLPIPLQFCSTTGKLPELSVDLVEGIRAQVYECSAPAAREFPMATTEWFMTQAAIVREKNATARTVILDQNRRIVDGRHTLALCILGGVVPHYRQFKDANFTGTMSEFALLANGARRNLKPSQLAIIGARNLKRFSLGGPEQPSGRAAERMAKALGISPRMIYAARKLLKSDKALAKRAWAGEISLQSALIKAGLVKPKKEKADKADESYEAVVAKNDTTPVQVTSSLANQNHGVSKDSVAVVEAGKANTDCNIAIHAAVAPDSVDIPQDKGRSHIRDSRPVGRAKAEPGRKRPSNNSSAISIDGLSDIKWILKAGKPIKQQRGHYVLFYFKDVAGIQPLLYEIQTKVAERPCTVCFSQDLDW